jgi:hypothetical protein
MIIRESRFEDRGNPMEQLMNILSTPIAREVLIFLAGSFFGVALTRWHMKHRKPQIYSQLDKARSHLKQDLINLRSKVGTFNTLLGEFSRHFDGFRQEIEQMDKDHHVDTILETARQDLSKLKSDEN